MRFSPLRIILLLKINSLLSFSKGNLIVPKVSCSFFETSWKDKFAVLPNKDLIRDGSSKPGNSTKILLLPCFKIFGSFVPISSTLLRTISTDWSNDAFLSSTIP